MIEECEHDWEDFDDSYPDEFGTYVRFGQRCIECDEERNINQVKECDD